jgi:hypothetical protein
MKFFKKKFKLSPIQKYSGYEETDEAFAHAHKLVLDVLKFEEFPRWGVVGQEGLNNYLSKFQKKVPDSDYDFLIEKKSLIWDGFRNYLMRPEIAGSWNEVSSSEAFKIFTSIFSSFPGKYKPDGPEWVEAAGTLHLAIDASLKSDKQILAEPIMEVVLILWIHFCNAVVEDSK